MAAGSGGSEPIEGNLVHGMDKGQWEGDVMKTPKAPAAFVQALHKQPVSCESPDCARSVEVTDISQRADRVKSFRLRCNSCQWEDTMTGCPQVDPPWDEGSLMEITEEHMLHLEPVCPYDKAPLRFHSLPNPRRRARYRITCYYCGRQEELDWPPDEAKR